MNHLVPNSAAKRRELVGLLSEGQVFTEGPAHREALSDGTVNRGLSGTGEVLVLPETTEEVAAVMAWCYEHDVPLVTRGGGSGLAGGAVPNGGLVLSTERMSSVRSIEPELWRAEVEAGVRTGTLHRIALENGLIFPPDPGASEQSTIGGNIATNAGGPHAFKYGVTGAWVTGLEVVFPPGEIVHLGGSLRKNVSSLDLVNLMTGSEGILGIVTAAWLRLVPAPETRSVVVAFYGNSVAGCEAVTTVMGSGIQATALEFLDEGALRSSAGSFPFGAPDEAGFVVLAEADGHPDEVSRLTTELAEALEPGSTGLFRLETRSDVNSLWNWRDGISLAVTAQRGGKISEDIAVPIDRLAEAVARTVEIGESVGLEACSWGHAGDGNLHSTFLVDLSDPDEMARGKHAAEQLFSLAIELGGSISGEHGIGSLKVGRISEALDPYVSLLQVDLKRLFDPKMLLNPGKKVPV